MNKFHLKWTIFQVLATTILLGCTSSPAATVEPGTSFAGALGDEVASHPNQAFDEKAFQTSDRQAAFPGSIDGETLHEGQRNPLPTAANTPVEAPSTNEVLAPELSPTIGVDQTIIPTPAPTEICPELGGSVPTIRVSDQKIGLDVMFTPQILAYLNAGGSAAGLEEVLGSLKIDDGWEIWRSKAQVLTIDVTGDITPEIVMDLSFYVEGQYAEGNLYIFQCQDGHYFGGSQGWILGQVFSAGDPDPGIRDIRDMNANGVAEIVYSYLGNIGTHANFSRLFHILEWDGTQFRELIQGGVIEPNAAEVANGDGEVRDFDGDGFPDLVLSHGSGHGPEASPPDRTHTDIWSWNGAAITKVCSEYASPEYRYQAVLDGDEATRCGQFDKALTLYQQAIFDESLLSWPRVSDGDAGAADTLNQRQLLSAYARYRILLLHAKRGYLPEAQIVYDTLRSKFPMGTVGHPYVELARSFWDEFTASSDIATACGRAIAYTAAHTDELLDLGVITLENPYKICPFE
jgi:hypothetical protein